MNADIAAGAATLYQLHTVDQELDALVAEQRDTPTALQARAEQLARDEAVAEATQAELESAQKAQSDAERELADLEKRAARALARMPTLTSAEQIASTEKEHARLQEMISDVETTILEGMERVEELGDRLQQQRAAAAGTASLAADRASWQTREPSVTDRITALKAQHAELQGQLRADIVRRYHLAWNQAARRRAGITWSDGERICLTCNREVPARWLQEAADRIAWHTCDGCKRLLIPEARPPEPDPEEGTEGADAAPQ